MLKNAKIVVAFRPNSTFDSMKSITAFKCLALFLFISLMSKAQITLSGTIFNESDHLPIPFANIGILDSEFGTISNQDGSFKLMVPEKYADREVIFSAIGYERMYLAVLSFDRQENLQIILKEKPIDLEPVIVKSEQGKERQVTIGNGRSLLIAGQLYCDTNSAGSAMALKIDKNEWSNLKYVHSAKLYIAKNKFPEFKVRLRILEIDSLNGNIPGKDLLNEQVIYVSDISKGWLEFDMGDLDYTIMEDSFYIMFEWILEEKDRRMITQAYDDYIADFPQKVVFDTIIVDGEKLSIPMVNKVLAGTIFGVTHSNVDDYVCYYRTNSFGEWKRSTGVLSAKVELGNRPK